MRCTDAHSTLQFTAEFSQKRPGLGRSYFVCNRLPMAKRKPQYARYIRVPLEADLRAYDTVLTSPLFRARRDYPAGHAINCCLSPALSVEL